MADPPALTDVGTALRRFAFPSEIVQTSEHIRSLHWYVACRLVIEGGFRPTAVVPRPPFTIERRGGESYLHHNPSEAKGGERTILGGLKTKKVDVSVCIPGVGPVVAISLKGTHNAFRNLTNRMEEAAGDCTNLHMAYPGLVYGFWHVLRANEEDDEAPIAHFTLSDGKYRSSDFALLKDGNLASGVRRYAHALERLSDREDLRDHPSKYEACGLTLVNCRGGPSACSIHGAYPDPEGLLDYNRMFKRLYLKYDERFVYQAPALKRKTSRVHWARESPVIADTISSGGAFDEMTPRVR